MEAIQLRGMAMLPGAEAKLAGWRFVEKTGKGVACYKDCEGKNGKPLCVRISLEGVHLFKKGRSYVSMKDFKGSKGQGFSDAQLGAILADGSLSLKDEAYESTFSEKGFGEMFEAAKTMGQFYFDWLRPDKLPEKTK